MQVVEGLELAERVKQVPLVPDQCAVGKHTDRNQPELGLVAEHSAMPGWRGQV
jgi:hypothetical protein